jgi:exodeoxyribonuclease VII large subunit
VLVAQRARLQPLATQIEHFNPQRVLERGYAIVFDSDGNILKDARQAAPGLRITAQLAKGRLRARVEESGPPEG